MSGQSKIKIVELNLCIISQQKIEILEIQEHHIIHDDTVKHESIQGKNPSHIFSMEK